ncbi:KEOPS complex subunit Cgi121 [Natronomonas moolapensis 8.8.11]|uniref:KEOPS complex subunit Cgi121 n=1 Tax=Natronomonas moolapensis (strain DSM 18674 / CECT 7526 / JCM 14361 / 8.8.11) TaxID=268739 RepID=M1XU72_NATM8|nr:KEOPS complex subunit Cgi121 [Natronomonas moolapensis]CCQ38042.1 KEOPS complex subunit Cgi121 [Natronomonas moolapensis 8.8.11]
MRLIEGIVSIGGDRFADVDAFLERTGEIATAHDATVQAFDARYVVSRRHIARAVELADRERARGEAIARDRGVEIALYAAGRRQIDRAFEMGLSPGETPAVVLVDGPGEEAAAEAIEELLASAPTLGAYDEARVRSFYDIDAAELEATDAGLAALVLERVALLVVER